MASSSSSVHNKSYLYNVFLSFSGVDTRKTFVDHLYAALDQQGIHTFKDDESLQQGKKISVELLQSIEGSRLYIIVFSKNYASSSWCLDELLKIMECHNTNKQTVLPVFYDVEPSEVRKQTGSVGEALDMLTNKDESKVGKWREALKEAANLSGWDVRKTANGHEAKVIKLIVEQVSRELRPIDIDVDKDLVGMEQRMQDLDSCLEIGTDDVRMIGIKGMGGAGKTTLAWAIFNNISYHFEGKSFVENVREKAASQNGLEKLQEKVLTDVLNRSISVGGVHEGKELMRKNLRGKKVLVVLDDVDHKYQLEMLAGDITWFKPGSRIIITTREGQVLEAHKVKWIRDVNLLSDEEAICLFSRHAFGKDIPTQDYETYSQKVVIYADGLPLTIKVLGSDLCGKDANEWKHALKRLKTIPLEEPLKKLELSYINLEDEHKEIFLDVACFLRGRHINYAITMLESCGFFAKHGLKVLEQKSLIVTLKRYDVTIIDMHDHLVEMGKNIVRREHPDEPNKHSRLWVQEEIERVLVDNSGSETIRCVDLKITPDFSLEGLRNMKKLRCLLVNRGDSDIVKFDVPHLHVPNSLQYLIWQNYPYWCLPKTLEANNLVGLEISYSSEIKQLWEGEKVMTKLKSLVLSCSDKLRSLDLGLTPNLERLNLKSCSNLVELDVHGGCLKSLVYLNLSFCTSLKSISFIKQFESLEVLHICCLNLKEFPDYIITGHSINNLLELDLSGNYNLEEVPSSIGNLHKLVSLHIGRCYDVKSLPGSICSLQRLRTLNLEFAEIKELPEDLGQLECLENLNLHSTHVKHLPGSICMLKHLKTLLLSACYFLKNLPEDVGQLESLEILDLKYCSNLRELPNSICKLKCLKELNLLLCSGLEKLPDELGDLKSLRKLDIRETGIITHLPQSISLLKGLEILRSKLKDWKHLNFKNVKHLKTLLLWHCMFLKNLPEVVGRLESLEKLDLAYCPNLRELQLKCLKELNLQGYRRLEKLPDELGYLKRLQVLDVRGTGIIYLPHSISFSKELKIYRSELKDQVLDDDDDFIQLCSMYDIEKRQIQGFQHLKTLDLRRCVIEEVPEALGQLECLEELHLNCKNVKHLPDTICMLKHLKKLFLVRCLDLEKLPDDVGQSEESCGSIEELPDALGHLECLRVLHLSYIDVKNLPDSICILKHLKILVLQSCVLLEKLPDDVGQLESLEELELSRCYSIREIPSSTCMLKHLKKLRLEGCRRLEKLPDELGLIESLQFLVIWDTGIRHLPQSISLLNGLEISLSSLC